MPTDIITKPAFLIFCSTGCSCCRSENYYQGFYDTLEEAIEIATYKWRNKSIRSQYSDNGEYTIYEVAIEEISHDRIILDGQVVFKKDEDVCEYTEFYPFSESTVAGEISSSQIRDTPPGQFHMYEAYKKLKEKRK